MIRVVYVKTNQVKEIYGIVADEIVEIDSAVFLDGIAAYPFAQRPIVAAGRIAPGATPGRRAAMAVMCPAAASSGRAFRGCHHDLQLVIHGAVNSPKAGTDTFWPGLTRHLFFLPHKKELGIGGLNLKAD